jgi:hypothetical protein
VDKVRVYWMVSYPPVVRKEEWVARISFREHADHTLFRSDDRERFFERYNAITMEKEASERDT